MQGLSLRRSPRKRGLSSSETITSTQNPAPKSSTSTNQRKRKKQGQASSAAPQNADSSQIPSSMPEIPAPQAEQAREAPAGCEPGGAHMQGPLPALVQHAGLVHSQGFSLTSQYQTPAHPYPLHGTGYPYQANQTQPNNPHVAWQGYPYAYQPVYGGPHPGYQPYGTTAHALPSQGGGSNAQFGIDPTRLANPPSFPTTSSSKRTAHALPSQGGGSNAQFGVDPARLANPPSFPTTPSSKRNATAPAQSLPPTASPSSRRSIINTTALQRPTTVQTLQLNPQRALAVQTPQVTPQRATVLPTPQSTPQQVLAVQTPQPTPQQGFTVQTPQLAPQQVLAVQTPQPTPHQGLAIQTPQLAPQQVLAVQTPQPTPHQGLAVQTPQLTPQQVLAVQTPQPTPQQALAVQAPQQALADQILQLAPHERAVDDDDDDDDDDDNDGNNPGSSEDEAAGSTGPRRSNVKGGFVATGKGKYRALIEKWNTEARAKGYNPDKAASGTNPWAGYVEGAGLGGEEDRDMYRRNYILPPFTDQAQNTRTYRRWVIDLMTKAEDISRRTGCLFYMIAQHATAGKPYSWYVSPKLRREAPQAVEQFHGLAAQTFVNLLKAEKETKIGLVGELKDAKAAQKAAEDELAQARRELAVLKANRDESQLTQITFVQPTLTLERLQQL